MNSLKKISCVMSIVAVLGIFIASAMAMPQSGTVKAGFTDLPLRNCEGTYCAEIKKLAIGQQLKILYDTGDGWSYVEVVGSGEKGWVCNANVF